MPISLFSAASAGRGAGTGAAAGDGGGLPSVQPAGPAEFECCFGAEHGIAQLRGSGILCQNSGHDGFIGHHGNIEIVHCQAPLFHLGSSVVFPCFQGVLYPSYGLIARHILAMK